MGVSGASGCRGCQGCIGADRDSRYLGARRSIGAIRGHWGFLGCKECRDHFKGVRGHQGCRGCQGCIGGMTGTLGTQEPEGV